MDEIWSFVYAKQKNVEYAKNPPRGAGDVWTWTAICADTKLIPSWRIGDRTGETALDFMDDLSKRLRHRVQLTSDGHRPYLEAVWEAFGGDVDYAMLVKLKTTPAVKAGVARYQMDLGELVRMIDAVAPKPSRPKTYRKRQVSK